jgi:hypothetical protein
MRPPFKERDLCNCGTPVAVAPHSHRTASADASAPTVAGRVRTMARLTDRCWGIHWAAACAPECAAMIKAMPSTNVPDSWRSPALAPRPESPRRRASQQPGLPTLRLCASRAGLWSVICFPPPSAMCSRLAPVAAVRPDRAPTRGVGAKLLSSVGCVFRLPWRAG